jgi:phosphatidylglycerol:prolipoprotein diacylglycerol transferase
MILLGGVVFGTLMITIYTILKRLHWGKVADIVTPGVVVGIAMGRVGCFFNGCCFGKPSNLPWAVHFPPGSFAHYVYPDTGIHPTQLYEILCSLLIFIVLIKIEKRKPFQGFSFALFLILYGAFRFLNEFLRYYGGFEAGMNLLRIGGINITFSQITAIFMIFAGIIIILIGKRSIKFEQKA